MFEIIGKLEDFDIEVIDSADTYNEAVYMLGEYEMAFGNGWILWIKDNNIYGGRL